MKKSIFTAAMLAIAFTFSGQVGAQGRHDERPHGQQPKAPAKASESARQDCAGRHDECPHGVKPAAKKPLEKTSRGVTPKDAK